MDSEGFFCGPTAALLRDLPLPLRFEADVRLHVAVPSPHRAPRGRGVLGHKFLVAEGEVVEYEGVRISSLERTWCDLAGQLTLSDLVAVGDAALRRGADPERLTALAHRHPGRRGRGLRLRAVGMLDGRAESRRESHTRVALALEGLTQFEPNVVVEVPGFRYRLDLAWRSKRIAIEYQGGYHHDPAQWRRDITRRERLIAAGWVVVFVTADDLADPAELAARIRRLAVGR